MRIVGIVVVLAALAVGGLVLGGYLDVSGQATPTPKAQEVINQAKQQANTTANQTRQAAGNALESLSKKVK